MSFIRELGSDELIDLGLKSDELFLKPQLEDLPQQLRQATEHPDSYWQGQRATIRARITRSEKSLLHPAPILAWACLGMLIAVALLALRMVPWRATSPLAQGHAQQEFLQPRGSAAQNSVVDPDHEFLLELEESLQSGGPSALAPASVLAQDTGQYSPSLSHRKKEPVHEN